MKRLNRIALAIFILTAIIVFIALSNYFRREAIEMRRWGSGKNYIVAKVGDGYGIKIPSGLLIGNFPDSLSAAKFIPKLVGMNKRSGIAR